MCGWRRTCVRTRRALDRFQRELAITPRLPRQPQDRHNSAESEPEPNSRQRRLVCARGCGWTRRAVLALRNVPYAPAVLAPEVVVVGRTHDVVQGFDPFAVAIRAFVPRGRHAGRSIALPQLCRLSETDKSEFRPTGLMASVGCESRGAKRSSRSVDGAVRVIQARRLGFRGSPHRGDGFARLRDDVP